MKTKFIVIGTGNRGVGCFAKGLLGFPGKGRPEFRDHAELAALVDTNLTRGRTAAKECKLPDLPIFRTVAEAQSAVHADWCIITTPDNTHCQIATQALEAGLNVMIDKPLATSVWECDKIIATMNRTGRKVLVGHNLRYMDGTVQAAQMVRDGVIGQVLLVEAAEILELNHGGSYFQRWHSDFSKSAGLMNHKGCHYLDLLCWILDDQPVEVSSFGERSFYVPKPDLNHAERCLDCQLKTTCPHYYDMDRYDGVFRRLYKDSEGEDGYVTDRCVFSDRHTINDHESLNIRFARGTLASFCLNTFSPRSHSYFYFTGTKGRLELGHSSVDGKPYLRLVRPDKTVQNIDLAADKGDHGHDDADVLLIADMLGLPGSLPIQKAQPWEARRAVMIADMSSRSISAGGRPVKAEETGHDYPPAPPKK